MINPELEKFLIEKENYYDLKEIPNRGICGVKRFMFTTAIVFGLDETGYYGRYCYEHFADAREAFKEWDGVNDPSGEWIKYKGYGGERSRVKDEFED